MRRLRCLIRGCCRLRARGKEQGARRKGKGQGARRKGKEQGARGKEKRYLAGSSICAIYVLMHRCDVAALRRCARFILTASLRDKCFNASLHRCARFNIRCVFAALREIYFNCVSAALRDIYV